MIKFPNLDNYVSNYNDPKSIIKIRIDYNPKNKSFKNINNHYAFGVRSPFPGNILVEVLNKIATQRKLEIVISLLPDKTICRDEPINIWQLVWFINNIVEYKRVLISIEEPNNENHWIHTGVYLNDEKDFNRLKEQINRFYDEDFDGIVDNK